MDLEPVELVWERQCTFQARTCGACDLPKANKVHTPKRTATCQFKRRNGCARCGMPKAHVDHFGGPPSVNVYGRTDHEHQVRIKQYMQGLITVALEGTDLPRPCEAVMVECEITFPDTTDRDEGNMRGPLEKALGDALTEGGWLVGDTFFPVRRFSFGAVTPRHEPGMSRTRLVLFPSMQAPQSVVIPKAKAPVGVAPLWDDVAAP